MIRRRGMRFILAGFLCWMSFYGTVDAQTVQLSIPDTTALSGDTLLLPIITSPIVESDSVFSGQLTLFVSSYVIDILGIETAGTLMESVGSVLYNTATKTFAFASDSVISGTGPLLYLRVHALENPLAQWDSVRILSASLNEGNPSVTIRSGYFRHRSITVSPSSPSRVIVGDQVQFSVTGDVVPPLSWATTDTSVATVDQGGNMTARQPGQVRVLVSDAQGLSDSTELFAVNPVFIQSLTMSVPDTSYTQTLMFDLPVFVSDVTDIGIVSAQFSLTYNASHLQAIEVVTANSMTAGWISPSYNIISGRIDAALAGSTELTGSGVLAYVRFRVNGQAFGLSAITLAGVLLNESINAAVVNGSFTAIPAPELVILPDAATITRGDTLRFQVTSGGTPPFTWSSSDTTVAAIDPTTGLMTALGRGTTSVAVVDSFGFVGSAGPIVVNDILVSVPDTLLGLTDTLDIPVRTEDLTGLDILSFEGRIGYDGSVVALIGLSQTSTLTAGWSATYKDTLDTLRVAWAGTTALVGGGTLFNLRFTTAPGAIIGEESPITLESLQFNEPGSGTPTATPGNGGITIIDSALAAPGLASPANRSTGVPLTVKLEWTQVFRATEYIVQVSTDNGFSTLFDAETLAATSYDLRGLATRSTYYWRVAARNAKRSGPFSEAYSFETFAIIPDIPRLDYPENTSEVPTVTPVLRWYSSLAAMEYRIQVARDRSFTSPVVDVKGITDTTFRTPPLDDKTRYTWRVSARNTEGESDFSELWEFTVNSSVTNAGDPTTGIPRTFVFREPYPNPFNPSTSISFDIPYQSMTRLEIIDMLGRIVAVLLDGPLSAGSHHFFWNASDVPSGVYIVRFRAASLSSGERQSAVKRISVLK